jgi:hypothetical protein
MYNKRLIIPGLVIFIALVTSPIWYNGLVANPLPPKPALPEDSQNCVLPKAEMRDTHMSLLNEWRDDVLRDGNRVTVTVDGKTYRKGLQLACMQCHTNKEKFCDSCHEYASVKPYCWDCHLTPKEIDSKKETL